MLKQQIQLDSNEALKRGGKETVGVLRLALAAVLLKEKEKRYKVSTQKAVIKEEEIAKESSLTDEQVLEVLSSEIKKRKDAIILYQKGNRPELAQKEQMEIKILRKYLPDQLSREELEKLVQESIFKTGAKEMKDMGKVIADLMPKVKNKADNSEISTTVKKLLQ